MATPAFRQSKPRFGFFELDPASGELRKGNLRLKLHPQPFRLLCLLVERAGEVVTREEIRNALWDADTFVEFERGINFCISQIRTVLSDDPENPRYVETLPKLGYRFIAPLSAPVLSISPPPAPVPAVSVRSRRVPLWTVALGLAVIFVAGLLAWFWPRSARPTILNSKAITHDGRPKGTYATLAGDGARIYFEESAASRSFVAQVAASGGETSEIPVPLPVPTIYDLSPDGSMLLLGSLGPKGIELWIQSLPSGALRRVGGILASDGGWAPDGEHIVFVDGHSVYFSKADGSDLRLLAKTGGDPAWPRVSPDGRRIRFTVFDVKESATALWEVSSDGTGLHELLAGWNPHPNECCGNWTPDGKYFVLQSERDGVKNLWVIRESGFRTRSGGPVQLTSGPLDFFAPLPGRDGKRLFAIGQQNRSELVRFDLKSRSFEPYLGGISATDVRLSPDGHWAAYVAYPEGTLWRSAVDGSQALQLTSSPARVMRPRWSPDATRIAFTSFQPGKPPAIYVVPAEGGGITRIGPDFAMALSWSPDGKSAVFNSLASPDSAGLSQPARILVFSLQTQRTSLLPGSEDLLGPEWSPDGKYILAKSADDHRAMLFDLAAGKWSELTRGEVLTNLHWSREGDAIYFERTSAQDSVLIRLQLRDRKLDQVMDFRGIRRPLITLSSPWSGSADDGSPILQRDIGTQEVYALDWKLP
jgi:Tol biopolymer transport system component/DNA-binding winged helix-turn-helix (wHTH) protein